MLDYYLLSIPSSLLFPPIFRAFLFHTPVSVPRWHDFSAWFFQYMISVHDFFLRHCSNQIFIALICNHPKWLGNSRTVFYCRCLYSIYSNLYLNSQMSAIKIWLLQWRRKKSCTEIMYWKNHVLKLCHRGTETGVFLPLTERAFKVNRVSFNELKLHINKHELRLKKKFY